MENAKEKKKTNIFIEILKWIQTILLAVVIALLIRGFIFEPVIVRGVSMEDTLINDQRLIIYKLGYFFDAPDRGDIVVLQYQKGIFENIPVLNRLGFLEKFFSCSTEIDYIKRVIGVPGDEIDILEGIVYVNGKKTEETYAKGTTYRQVLEFPVVVPEDMVFVMGDNRENSRDSRVIGFIEYDRLVGKAVLRIWPFDDISILKK